MNFNFSSLCVLLLSGAGWMAGPQGRAAQPDSTSADSVAAQAVYEKHCAACHGMDGNGQGPAAYLLYPKPRDFTAGTFKFTSTAPGDPPVDADLIRTIQQGMPGTSMPSFGAILSDQEIQAVVRYIRAFGPPYSTPQVIEIQKPENLETDVAHGQQVFTTLGCVQCHGEDGMAETPTAKTLKNIWGEPNPPAPISYGVFKRGGRMQDIVLTVLTGIKGTGMPGFAPFLGQAGLNEQAFWDLAAFVLSLSEDGSQKPISDEAAEVDVKREDFLMPHDPWDVHWEEVQPVVLRMHPLWKRHEPPPPIAVRAVHNDQSMAVMMEWEDATKDWAIGDPRFAPDAVAIQYPVRGNEAPFIGMGAQDLKSVVRIWHWQAHRQERITNHDMRDVEQTHPNMAVDWYPDELNRRIGERPTFRGNEDGLLNQDPLNIPAMAVNNPVIRRDLLGQAALEYLVQGFGSLTGLAPNRNFVEANGVWLQGKWRVVMQRPLETGDTQDRVFRPGQDVWIALAIWDGFHGDRNGQKSVTRWVRFNFEE